MTTEEPLERPDGRLFFLVDAHLPPRAVAWLRDAGHDGLHACSMPAGSRTSDTQIMEAAEQNGWVVLTKDHDFLDSHLLRNLPPKLVLVTLGNRSNRDLRELLVSSMPGLFVLLRSHGCVELDARGPLARGPALS